MLHLCSERKRSKLRTCFFIKKQALAISVTRFRPGISINAQTKALKYEELGALKASLKASKYPTSNDGLKLFTIYIGTTPQYAFDVPVGDHTTKLTKSGYNDWETTKYVYADENVGVSTTLIPELMDCTSVVGCAYYRIVCSDVSLFIWSFFGAEIKL